MAKHLQAAAQGNICYFLRHVWRCFTSWNDPLFCLLDRKICSLTALKWRDVFGYRRVYLSRVFRWNCRWLTDFPHASTSHWLAETVLFCWPCCLFAGRSRSTSSWSRWLEGNAGSWRAAAPTTWRQWKRSSVSSSACWRTKTQSLQGYDATAANARRHERPMTKKHHNLPVACTHTMHGHKHVH